MMRHLLRSSYSAALAVSIAVILLAPTAALGESRPRDRATLSAKFARDLERLDGTELYGAFIHFSGATRTDPQDLLSDYELRIQSEFPQANAVFAVGRVGEFRQLRNDPAISYLEADRKLRYYGETAPWASRARVAQETVAGGPYKSPAGAVLDGSGVGVAVIDTGIDGTHPDLANRVAKNYKIVCTTPFLTNRYTGQCYGEVVVQEAPITDTTGGHGTHVAGIVAGDGTASDGTYKGVAPGASLYGFGVGETIYMITVTEALQFILDNYSSFNPGIRVINNSYGDSAGTAYDPNSVFSKLVDDLVAKGVTFVFAAGNDGGSGTADRTSSFSKSVTPGVISAANYDDTGTGSRENQLNSSSSRGQSGSPSTYPDISAPGTFITSTCNPALTTCDAGPAFGWAPRYASLSGTSMASPHVAGIAALLLQANPALTPGEVEDTLQDSAHQFIAGGTYEDDPQNPGSTTSFDKGAGLVDVPAALRRLGLTGTGGVSAMDPQMITSGDGGDYPLQGAADIVGLSVVEEEAGLRYTLQVRDVADVGPTSVNLRVTQNVNGKSFRTTVTVTRTGVSIPAADTGGNTAPPTEAARNTETNSVTLLVPFSRLGTPPANAPAHNVYVSSFTTAIVDVAPGGSGADVLARPRFGAPYTVHPVTTPEPTESPTISPTVSPSVEPSPSESAAAPSQPTSVRFTAGSATSGQYTDPAFFEARLVDSKGAAIAGAELVFELTGPKDHERLSATTGNDGVARETLTLMARPGPYQLTVRYGGEEGTFDASADVTGFLLDKEESTTALSMDNNGTLLARLSDGDDSSAPISHRIIEFLADGRSLGTATTDRDGVAALSPPKRYRNGAHTFEARFHGDDFFEYSSARVKT